jgi:bifunctional UDP-N-acetylglucosamine pyrophosphorylase/glucosamine-1-phosphate N-acetyltransferase
MSGDLLVLLSDPTGRRGTEPGNVGGSFPLLGRALISILLSSASSLKPKVIYYLGRDGGNDLRAVLRSAGARTAQPTRWEGAAKAVLSACGLPGFKRKTRADVLVLDARFPLLSPKTLRALQNRHRKQKNALTALTGRKATPAIIARFDDLVEAATDAGRKGKASNDLSALVEAASLEGKKIGTYAARRPEEILAVASTAAAGRAAQVLRAGKIRRLEAGGVIVLDPATVWVDLDVRIGRGTVLYPAVVIEGPSRIGRDCRIYPFVHIVDTRVGDRVKVFSSTMIERSLIRDDARIGPFSHFRPDTVIKARAKVGNFVEMKNTVFGEGSKAGHLSYLGDAVVEPEVNVGAGTITCNYDGVKKSRTLIGRGAFIGSGTELVAPVKIGKRAYIGAGSTITRNVPPGALAVARSRQVEKPGWTRRRLKK